MDPDPDFRPIRIRTQEKKFDPDPDPKKKPRIRNTGTEKKSTQVGEPRVGEPAEAKLFWKAKAENVFLCFLKFSAHFYYCATFIS